MARSDEGSRERREAVVQRHIAAENGRNLDAMIESFSKPRYDVVPVGAVCEGEQAVRELVGGLLAGFPDFHFQPTKLHHADDAVIVEARMTGTHRGAWAGLEPKGNRMDIRAICVFDFEGDGLVNETVYFDFGTLQRQLTGIL